MTKGEVHNLAEGSAFGAASGTGRRATWLFQNTHYLDAMNQADLEIDDEFFHFVHPSVADADIRRRDESYRRRQDSALRRYLLMYDAPSRGESL
jgi:hypothetical protein